jgi:hypothetical protein
MFSVLEMFDVTQSRANLLNFLPMILFQALCEEMKHYRNICCVLSKT